jgi:hypothetical protein
LPSVGLQNTGPVQKILWRRKPQRPEPETTVVANISQPIVRPRVPNNGLSARIFFSMFMPFSSNMPEV